ncbi:MAG: hypothetical protein U0136_03005 [Bdellovibrionota bacterium]
MEVTHVYAVVAAVVAVFAVLFSVRLLWSILMSSIQLFIVAGVAVIAIHFAAPGAVPDDIMQTLKGGVSWAERLASSAGTYLQLYRGELLADRKFDSAGDRHPNK